MTTPSWELRSSLWKGRELKNPLPERARVVPHKKPGSVNNVRLAQPEMSEPPAASHLLTGGWGWQVREEYCSPPPRRQALEKPSLLTGALRNGGFEEGQLRLPQSLPSQRHPLSQPP